MIKRISHPTDNLALWKTRGEPFCDCLLPPLSVSVLKRSEANTHLPHQCDSFVRNQAGFFQHRKMTRGNNGMLTVTDGAQEGPGACQPPPAPLGLAAVKRLLRGAERPSPASCFRRGGPAGRELLPHPSGGHRRRSSSPSPQQIGSGPAPLNLRALQPRSVPFRPGATSLTEHRGGRGKRQAGRGGETSPLPPDSDLRHPIHGGAPYAGAGELP